MATVRCIAPPCQRRSTHGSDQYQVVEAVPLSGKETNDFSRPDEIEVIPEEGGEALPEKEGIEIPIVFVVEANEESNRNIESSQSKTSERSVKPMIWCGLLKIRSRIKESGWKVKGKSLHLFSKRTRKQTDGKNRGKGTYLRDKCQSAESSYPSSMLSKVSVLETDQGQEVAPFRTERESAFAAASTRTTRWDTVTKDPVRYTLQAQANEETCMDYKNTTMSKLSSLLITVSTKFKKGCATDAEVDGMPSTYPIITVKDFHGWRSNRQKSTARGRLSSMVASVSTRSVSVVSRCMPIRNTPRCSAKDSVSEFTINSLESDGSEDSDNVSVALSIASHLSMLVAGREGEIDKELAKHVDLFISKFGQQRVKRGLKARIREVGVANFVNAELQKSAEGIVDEIDMWQLSCLEAAPVACSMDAFNDLIACGTISETEVWAENFKAAGVALGYIEDDADSAKTAQKDNGSLASAADDDGVADLFVQDSEGTPIHDLYFFSDNDSTSLKGSIGSFIEALDECNDFDMAMELLVDRAASEGVGEMDLLEKIWTSSNN